jgi:hypothetical protein
MLAEAVRNTQPELNPVSAADAPSPKSKARVSLTRGRNAKPPLKGRKGRA